MKLSETLTTERITLDLQGTDKESVIRELVALAARHGALKNPDNYLRRVLEREFLLSTGLGHGVAVPHAQAEGIDGLCCCLGISKQGVDYESIDDEPARIICLIAAEEGNDGPYLLLLSHISRLLAQGHVRDGLLAAETPEAALELIRRAEDELQRRLGSSA